MAQPKEHQVVPNFDLGFKFDSHSSKIHFARMDVKASSISVCSISLILFSPFWRENFYSPSLEENEINENWDQTMVKYYSQIKVKVKVKEASYVENMFRKILLDYC